ncbi:MAG TPA: hemerythrin domain-containing protein [Acidimicrobiales bacterium]|nr:hemerythrin domain-containing protein [Acidimicrobiales bacterium]
MADLFALLEREHAQTLDLLRALSDAAGADRGPILDELVRHASRHETAEEMYFWPAVRDRVTGGGDLARMALTEEKQAAALLDRLRTQNTERPADPDFDQALRSVTVALESHVAYEQEAVWPALREALTPPDVEAIGTELEVALRTGPTRPHPHAPVHAGRLKLVAPIAAWIDRARDRLSGR